MAIVQIQTPGGFLNTEGEIIGELCVADLTPFMENGQAAWGVAHLKTGLGLAAFTDEEIALAYASNICEAVEWDSVFERVMNGIHMDAMPEITTLEAIFRRSLHDSHTIKPLAVAWYCPSIIAQEVETHRHNIHGDAN